VLGAIRAQRAPADLLVLAGRASLAETAVRAAVPSVADAARKRTTSGGRVRVRRAARARGIAHRPLVRPRLTRRARAAVVAAVPEVAAAEHQVLLGARDCGPLCAAAVRAKGRMCQLCDWS
jgi:hypothetical protein